ncbi:MAG TPA: GTP 3',8-cyclase MoaA [Anaerolineae bacterium]|nr:GTP 3',8-cyclase MoaA [Anaerolineae bacterium]HOQ99212.1 GTP 3',8-cyclase MoaA [Anaerolineae bacterium]HPL28826.1 GTP 3',8-cyclase MoaA [Anaerolineae bacterium]
MPYLDSFNRPIEYLRISVTDRCNLRCVYCMPEEGVAPLGHEAVLRYEEIARLARLVVGLGVSKLRLTGGEPLARKGVEQLVAMLAGIPGVRDLAMTTNGTLLAGQADALARAGLRRVNVSLDTLRAERYHAMTRRGQLADVLAGLAAAGHAGLAPVKINMVVVRGLNDDEVVDFARKTVRDGWHVRFIEVMPLGAGQAGAQAGFVPTAETRAQIEAAFGPLTAVDGSGAGPARYYRIAGASGSIGFISPLSEHFCFGCNRLRLTADGQLMPCLMSERAIDLRSLLRRGANDDELQSAVRAAIAAKPAGHHMDAGPRGPGARPMSRIGG